MRASAPRERLEGIDVSAAFSEEQLSNLVAPIGVSEAKRIVGDISVPVPTLRFE